MRWTRRATCALALAPVAALLAGCSYGGIAPVESASRPPVQKSSARPDVHIVKRGDTLYSIAWRYGLDYRQVAAWNEVPEPHTIYPSQKLRLTQPPRSASMQTTQRPSSPLGGIENRPLPPPSSSQSKTAPAPGMPSKSVPKASASSRTASTGSLKKSDKRAAKGGNAPVKRWHWPAKGRIVTTYSQSGGRGIDIAGKFGQPILAASNGRVVYSGSGLIGYGQLIIVKHNKRYLSAYAQNNKILVKEGDTVTGGQRIAEMGRSGSNRVLLHFEIRRDGKPIDPVRYLPK